MLVADLGVEQELEQFQVLEIELVLQSRGELF